MRRYLARPDNNQKGIAEGLRAVGATVQFLTAVGKGCPDLIVGFKNRNFLFEIKNPKAMRGKPSTLRPNDLQEKWHAAWRGQVAVVTTLQQALDVLNPPLCGGRDAGHDPTFNFAQSRREPAAPGPDRDHARRRST